MSWYTVAPNAYIYKLADECAFKPSQASSTRADPLRR